MKNNKGFSLVELIVVIAIMAILAAVAVVSFAIYIDHAEEASDMDYISNVLYRVKLFSMEKGVEVQQVVISPEVNGPEDIQLIVKKPDGTSGYYLESDKSDIYETVGDYTMYGYHSSIEFDGIVIDPDLPAGGGGGGGLISGHHWVENEELHVASTCTTRGKAVYECTDPDCEMIQEITLPLGGHVGWTEDHLKDGYYVWQCTECQQIVIRSQDGNAVVPVLPNTPNGQQ